MKKGFFKLTLLFFLISPFGVFAAIEDPLPPLPTINQDSISFDETNSTGLRGKITQTEKSNGYIELKDTKGNTAVVTTEQLSKITSSGVFPSTSELQKNRESLSTLNTSTTEVTQTQIDQLKKIQSIRQVDTSSSVTSSGTYINNASSTCNTSGCTYTLLAPMGGLLGDSNGQYVIKKSDKDGLCTLLNSWFRIGIALAGMLAVVMIVLGGFQYATTDAMTGKEDGKGKIQNALWGLGLALATWLVISTVNPDLTKCTINASDVKLTKQATSNNVVSSATNGVLSTGSGETVNGERISSNSLTSWGDPDAASMTGKTINGRQTWYASDETITDSYTKAGKSAFGKLVEGTETTVGSAASVYYPAGTLVEVNGKKYIIDDNNIGKDGVPVNNNLTNNYTVDIYTTNASQANKPAAGTTNQTMKVLYVPTTKVGASGVLDIRNNPDKYINR